MKIAVITEERYLQQDMPGAVICAIEKRKNVHIDIITPRQSFFQLSDGVLYDKKLAINVRRCLDDYDAVISRNRCALGLAMLYYAGNKGVFTINSHASIQAVRDKANMAATLEQAGLPCAPSYLAPNVSGLALLQEQCFPLILKPTYGDNSQGLRLIEKKRDLENIHWGDELVLAQRYVPNDGFDLKLYVCGEAVFAVRKPSIFNGDPAASSELVQADQSIIDLAYRCGELFGLEIYGVDTILSSAGPVVIEVNDFPNFSGIPNVAELISDYVLDRIDANRNRSNANQLFAATK